MKTTPYTYEPVTECKKNTTSLAFNMNSAPSCGNMKELGKIIMTRLLNIPAPKGARDNVELA